MNTTESLVKELQNGNVRALAKCITVVENELPGFADILMSLKPSKNIPIIGFTGPPGAGKSTLINALLNYLRKQNLRIGVLAVDPTSPFNYGSLLGDRVRMNAHFLSEHVFIRSLATRGSLGGLSAKTIEITELMKAFDFDYIFVETVGVGQSEVEIVGLADTTVLVLVPEAGDEVQSLKSGVMEIASIFVVNKSDRPGASKFLKNLHELTAGYNPDNWMPKVIRTSATEEEGMKELMEAIQEHLATKPTKNKVMLYTEKAYQLIQQQRMKSLDKKTLSEFIDKKLANKEFNLFQIVNEFLTAVKSI
jgi:LAO/AO transport system kinase